MIKSSSNHKQKKQLAFFNNTKAFFCFTECSTDWYSIITFIIFILDVDETKKR